MQSKEETRVLLFNEEFLHGLHDIAGENGGDKWQKRRVVAHFSGYEDAKFIVAHMFATLGFPMEESAIWAGSNGYRLDISGLRHELLMLGMEDRTVDLHIQRMREAWEMARKDARITGE